MDDKLRAVIHRYSEDREIDYVSAKVLGEQYGKRFRSEKELVEFKQLIDRYLKTFNQNDWDAVKEDLGLIEKKKCKTSKKKKVYSERNEDINAFFEKKMNFDDVKYEEKICPKCKKKMKMKKNRYECPSCGKTIPN